MEKHKRRNRRKRVFTKKANIVFYYEVVPPEKSLFPEKLARANELLKDAILLP